MLFHVQQCAAIAGAQVQTLRDSVRDLLEWVKSETSGYYKDTLPVCMFFSEDHMKCE